VRRAEDKIMGDLFQPTHLLIIAIVLLVLFGGKKLPELGKGLGEGLKGFREGLKGTTEPAPPAPPTQQNAAPPAPPTTQNGPK
jgi:sec-independent protein translocase protein TatA